MSKPKPYTGRNIIHCPTFGRYSDDTYNYSCRDWITRQDEECIACKKVTEYKELDFMLGLLRPLTTEDGDN